MAISHLGKKKKKKVLPSIVILVLREKDYSTVKKRIILRLGNTYRSATSPSHISSMIAQNTWTQLLNLLRFPLKTKRFNYQNGLEDLGFNLSEFFFPTEKNRENNSSMLFIGGVRLEKRTLNDCKKLRVGNSNSNGKNPLYI